MTKTSWLLVGNIIGFFVNITMVIFLTPAIGYITILNFIAAMFNGWVAIKLYDLMQLERRMRNEQPPIL